MKKNFFKQLVLLLMMALVTVPAVVDAKKKVHTIGDSTAANQAETGNKRGWCQMLQPFFNADEMTVVNWAKSGASSKSFYKEASFWPTIEPQLEAGNYVLIQFAHNDEKTQGTDGDSLKAYYNSIGDASTAAGIDYRGTTPSDTYKKYLRKYIEDAKAKKAIPILVGPICRKYFKDANGTKINAAGCHNLYQSFSTVTNNKGTYTFKTGNSLSTDDHSMDYVYQMKQVAAEYDDVPFIDLTTATKDMYESYGDAVCTSDIFCVTDAALGWTGDGTHPSPKGATLIARLFTSLLVEQAANETDAKKKAVLEGLAQYAVLSSDIAFSPVSGDLGEAYSGQQLMKEYNISGFGLKPSSGTATISVDGNYYLSTDKETWTKSISVDYSAGTLITSVYVRTNVSGNDPITGTLTVSTGDASSAQTLDLVAKPISLSGGEAFSVVWPTHDAAGTSATVTGKANTTAQTLSGLELKSYATIGDKAMQHLMIAGSNGAWPAGEIDEVSTRYVQYQVTAPEETTLNISKISMTVAGAGGGGMCCHIAYSKDAGFGTETRFAAIEGGMTANTPQVASTDCTVKLAEGESLYIRAYPWYNAAANTKYFCISDVTVEGMAEGNAVKIDGNVTLPLHGTDVTATYDPETMAVGFANIKLATGANFTVNGTKTYNAGSAKTGDGTVMINFKNTSGGSTSTTAEAANTITFSYTPADGFVFMPKKISVKGAKHGTGGGAWTVVASAGQNSETLANGEAVNRSGSNVALTSFEWTTSSLAATADEPLKIDISICNLGNGKEHSVSDLVIEGLLQGAASTATKYDLLTSVSPAGAGTVAVDPEMSSYKEGKVVSLSATKNFGYKFQKWTVNGTDYSTDATTTITMDEAKNVVAVFETVPVYTVDAIVKNDLDLSIGKVTLTPNAHNGKYEAGEQVTLQAETSKILKFMNWEDNSTKNPRTISVDKDITVTANYEVQDFIAVFDESNVGDIYAYPTTASYPFNADITWDAERKAQCAIVKVSDGSLVYTNDGKTVGTAGTPVVRYRNGVVLSGINGLYQNGYRTTDIAWQYQFSTKKFLSAKFVGDMAAKNMAHKTYKAQYSLDGKAFTDIDGATWDITANVICPFEFALPEAATDQDLVYVRITGTGTTQLSSSYSVENQLDGLDYYAHSEAGVGNLFILGEAVTADDEVAPVLTATIPAAGATGISASGNVVLTYNEKIQLSNKVNGMATLNGEKVTPVVSSKSVSFQYVNLEYGKTYTLSVPAGYVEDKSGNAAEAVELSFTIMNRQKPQPRIFDAVVDKTLALDYGKSIAATETMPKQYRYIQDAINDAPAAGDKPYLIYIKEGYYDDPNPYFNDSYGQRYDLTKPNGTYGGMTNYEVVSNSVNGNGTLKSDGTKVDDCRLVFINKPNVHLIGQATDKVTIATDRMDGGDLSRPEKPWYHVNAGAAVEIQKGADDALLSTLTIDNENWTKDKKAGPQALCLNTDADRVIYNELNVQSYQDDYKCSGTYNRAFWFKSRFEGSVDYIYGDCDVWFEECVQDINRKSGGFIVAPSHPQETRWGYVFNNNTIKSTMYGSDCQVYLGRPWHNYPKTVFLNTKMEIKAYDGYWYETMGGLPAIWAVKNVTDKNGNPLSDVSRSTYYAVQPDGHFAEGTYTSKVDNGDGKYKYTNANTKNALTDEELAQYTIHNVLAGDKSTNPSGYWNPLTQVEKTAVPQVTVNGNIAQWTADEYAISYVVTVNGKPAAFVTDARYVGNAGEVVTVQSVNENGILSAMSQQVTLSAATDVKNVEAEGGNGSVKGLFTVSGQKVSQKTQHGIYVEDGKSVAY